MKVKAHRLNTVWRELEDEESLGLKPEEKEIVKEFHTIICHQARIHFQDLPEEAHEINENIMAAEDNLVQIIRSLRQCIGEQERFVQNYPKWKQTRDSNVKKLKDVGNTLYRCKRNCSVSRLVGNSTTFIGGAMCGVSAILIPFTLGATTPLAITGLCTVVAGSATSVGTSITELTVVKEKAKKAQKIITKDKRATEDLVGWLRHACELTESMDSFMNNNVIKETKNILKDFINKVSAVKNSNDKTTIIKKTVDLLFKARVFICATPKGALQLGTLLSIAVEIMMLQNRNRLIFNYASITYRGVLTVLSFMNISVDASQALTSAAMDGAVVSKIIDKAVAGETVLSMPLDAVSILLTSIDIHNGSVSVQGEKILQVVKKMEKQADVLTRVYDDMTRMERKTLIAVRDSIQLHIRSIIQLVAVDVIDTGAHEARDWPWKNDWRFSRPGKMIDDPLRSTLEHTTHRLQISNLHNWNRYEQLLLYN